MPVRALCLLFALIAADAAAIAQINTERMRRRLGDDGLAVAIDASASAASGNSDFVILGVGGRADIQVGDQFAFVVGRFDLNRSSGAAFVDRQFAHLRYNRDLTSLLVAEVFTQIERNPQQRLQSRVLIGGGLRAEVVDRDSVGLAFGVTPMFEVERLDEALGDDAPARVRLSQYVAARIALPSGASLTTTTYYQPRANSLSDFRILSQAALSVPVTRYVRIRVSTNLRHDSDPPPSVERTDIGVETGLVLVVGGS